MKKKIKLLILKPTQFAVGMLEVDEKIIFVKALSRKKLRAFVDDTPVPVVISPEGDLYIVDHHHFLCVCYHVGVEKVRVKVVKDLSKARMGYEKFWAWMLKNRSAYPFCQFGEGPRKALYLPKDIRGLADDPYRSIAWFVRKSGGFENSDRNFAEFQWANFFRKHGLLDRGGPQSMQSALTKAVKLAQSPAAMRLPGFGQLNIEEKIKVIRRAKKKGKAIEADR
jgi:hypothetical protein